MEGGEFSSLWRERTARDQKAAANGLSHHDRMHLPDDRDAQLLFSPITALHQESLPALDQAQVRAAIRTVITEARHGKSPPSEYLGYVPFKFASTDQESHRPILKFFRTPGFYRIPVIATAN